GAEKAAAARTLARASAAGWVVTAAALLVVGLKNKELQALAAYDSSPIDWCEINYEVHPYVAEFWNTVSSVPLALVAIFVRTNDLVPAFFWTDMQTSMAIILGLMVIIGAGSVYFHATLSVFGQIMDEMGIIWIVQYSALFVLPPGKFPNSPRSETL
ncbi:Alkaline ceramidase, partial [Hondaea fermentalgiana]